MLEDRSDSTLKPTYLDLPKKDTFAIPESEPIEPPTLLNAISSPASEKTNSSSLATADSSTVAPSTIYEQGIRVLVVDDDPLTRKLMTRMLTRIGCKVTTAENGEIALDLILHPASTRPTPSSEDTGGSGGLLDGSFSSHTEESRFAIVFLDNQMPVMSGLEAVAKLRSLGRHDFVVGVTGNALLSDQEEYLEAGVDQYVHLLLYAFHVG
jgi:osomolarity two-component system, sensor histidine kinase SLN1